MNKETPRELEMCKARVWPQGEYRSVGCSRKAKRDGFCGIHHPDAEKKRSDKSRATWEKQLANSPHAQLAKAQARIKVLEDALRRSNEILIECSEELCASPSSMLSRQIEINTDALKEKS